jgi:hypothetical protein
MHHQRFAFVFVNMIILLLCESNSRLSISKILSRVLHSLETVNLLDFFRVLHSLEIVNLRGFIQVLHST